MQQEKIFIKNRHGLKIAVIIKRLDNPKGLAFVMHGLSGNKDQPHIKIFGDAFFESGYATVLFDTTNTFGESDGRYEDVTVTSNLNDLEDVINWSSKQPWHKEPFCLGGSSLGGMCSSLYAEKFPHKIKGLALLSTAISGKLISRQTEINNPGILEKWKNDGFITEASKTRPGLIKTLLWAYIEDVLKYDILFQAKKITMPALLIVGDNDKLTPLKHQKLLFNQLPGRKELHIISGAPHSIRQPEHLNEVRQILETWIKSLN